MAKSIGELEQEISMKKETTYEQLREEVDQHDEYTEDDIDRFEIEIDGLNPAALCIEEEIETEAEDHPEPMVDKLWNLHEFAREKFIQNGVDPKTVFAKNRFFHGSDPKRRNFIPRRVTNHLRRHNSIMTVRDTKEVYVYRQGYFQRDGETIVEEKIGNIFSTLTKNFIVNEGVPDVKRQTMVERDELGSESRYINCGNCIYDIEAGEKLSHSPKYRCTLQIPWSYHEDAECPNFLEYLSETVYEEDIPVIQEMFGLCLYNDIPIQKAFMLVGEGGNGKSTLINILKHLLGSENYSSVELQDLSDNRFKVAEMEGKLANLAADLPSRGLRDTATFKKLTGEDTISAERKNQDPFEFENYATMINSANSLPETPDDSTAFFRRWMIISFPYRFVDDPTEEMEKEKDSELVNKLTREEEMEGILKWAIEGLDRVLENGKLSRNPTTEELEKQYKRMENTVAAFSEERIVESESDNDWITKETLYTEYVSWCVAHGIEAEAKNQFSMKLQKHLPVQETRPTIRGTRKRAWKHIKWMEGKEPGEYEPDTENEPMSKNEDNAKDHKVSKNLEQDIYDLLQEEGSMMMPELMAEVQGDPNSVLPTLQKSEAFDMEGEELDDGEFVPRVSLTGEKPKKAFKLESNAGGVAGKVEDFVKQNEELFDNGIPEVDVMEFFEENLEEEEDRVDDALDSLKDEGTLFEPQSGKVSTM